MKNNYIKEINIIGAKVDQITDFIKYEREAAIHDLIAENSFRIKKDNFVGPFTMNLSLNSGQLVIDIRENKNKKEYNITKSISGLKKIIKSYHLACSNYYEQITSIIWTFLLYFLFSTIFDFFDHYFSGGNNVR